MASPIYQVTIDFKGITVNINDNGFWQYSYETTGEFPPGKTKERLVAKLNQLAEQIVPGQNIANNEPFVKPCQHEIKEMANQISRLDFDVRKEGQQYSIRHHDRNFELRVMAVCVGFES